MLVFQKGQCRQQKANVHNPNGTKFCLNCNHNSLVDKDNNCECCQLHILNKKKFTELKTFNKIIDAHRGSINEWAALPSDPDLTFGWPVRIGIINYFVPVKFFAEYLELPDLQAANISKRKCSFPESANLEKAFLDNVKKECAVLGRYMHAIK